MPEFPIRETSLFIKNYKSIGSAGAGFPELPSLTVVVGKNNSGKSALVDLMEFACREKDPRPNLGHRGQPTSIIMERKVGEKELRPVFREGVGLGDISYPDHWQFVGQRLVGSAAVVDLSTTRETLPVRFTPLVELSAGRDWTKYYNLVMSNLKSPLEGKLFRKVSAERDVSPETPSTPLEFSSTGQGLTNTISQILSRSYHPSELVEDKMLETLNKIYSPDTLFTRIMTQQNGDGNWEVYLDEENRGRIALSDSGSGLKTVLLVIARFILEPYITKRDLSDYVFAFEELENNLHPAIQRRLMRYLYDQAKINHCLVLLTTHSNVVIDLFSRDADAQIVHVYAEAGASTSRTIQGYEHKDSVFLDLDVRASDLLQANAIVWLEGPSDRIYFNRWISIMSEGELKEGTHYQCSYYGGKVLAHFGASTDDEEVQSTINMLKINRHSLVIIDSDKSGSRTQVNDTKRRIEAEVTSAGGYVWITAGREVENYIPPAVLRGVYRKATRDLGQYEDISEYLTEMESDKEGARFERGKVAYAQRWAPLIDSSGLSSALDLQSRMAECTRMIRSWNNL